MGFNLGLSQTWIFFATAKSVYAKIGTKLTLHNEAEAPFEYLGLVDSFDGYDVLQYKLVTTSSCPLNPTSDVC